MSEKLCVFCRNFDWDAVNYHYYSTLTGGDMEGGATCKKAHYVDARPADTEEFRKLILTAQTCPDYDEAK